MTAWYLALTLKATVLLVALSLVGWAARRTPAATRHFVWAAGLAVLLALPIFAVALPAWSPGWVSVLPEPSTPPAIEATTSEEPEDRPLTQAEAEALLALLATPGTGAAGQPEVSEGGGDAAVFERWTGIAATVSRQAAPWGVALWATGILAMSAWLGLGFWRRSRIAATSGPDEGGRLSAACSDVAGRLGIQRPVRLIVGDDRLVPMTWGFVRPVLYLPAAAHRWSAGRLDAVLLHELAHVKRYDSLSRLLAQLSCGVFWFHPLAWFSAARLLREQERACDDAVILAGADPHYYAETLVQIAREFRSPTPRVVGALAFSRRSNLEHRLLSILDPLERRKKMSVLRKSLILVVFAAVALPLAALTPAEGVQEPDQQQAGQVKRRPVVKVVPTPDTDVVGSVARRPVVRIAPEAQTDTPAVGQVARRPVVRVSPAPQVDSSVVGSLVPRVDSSLAPRVDSSLAGTVPRADSSVAGVVAPRVDSSAMPSVVPSVAPSVRPQDRRVRVDRGSPQIGIRIDAGRIELEAEGLRSLTEDIGDIRLADDGWLTLEEEDQRLEVRNGADGLAYSYSVGGTAADFNDDARAWANDVLARIRDIGEFDGDVSITLGGLDAIDWDEFEIPEIDFSATFDALETLQEIEIPELAFEEIEIPEMRFEEIEIPEMYFESMEFGELREIEIPVMDLEPLELALEGLTIDLQPLELALDDLTVDLEPMLQANQELAERASLLAMRSGMLGRAMSQLRDLSTTFGSINDGGWNQVSTWRDGDARVVAMWRGDVGFGDGIDDLVLDNDGEFVVDERDDDGAHRRLHAYVEDGVTVFEMFEDGDETAFDDQARAWLAPILDRLQRDSDNRR